ncbi:hypothetical protein WP1_304 [Pseudomonas phage WP1]
MTVGAPTLPGPVLVAAWKSFGRWRINHWSS